MGETLVFVGHLEQIIFLIEILAALLTFVLLGLQQLDLLLLLSSQALELFDPL